LLLGRTSKAQDKDGFTVLMAAACNNQNPKVIRTLLEAGADLEANGKDGFTALMCAAQTNKNPEVIMTLLKAGANGKAKDSERKTAFHYAKGNAKLKGTEAYRQLRQSSQ